MFYDVSLALDVVKDLRKAILSRVTDYEIYSYYLGYAFQIGKAMPSPFRTDKRPSFSIFRDKYYHGLLHKDFGDSRFSGDCFSFVEQRHPGLTYKEALQKVYLDIVLGKLRPYLGYMERKPTEKTTKLRKDIQYEPLVRESKIGDDYWNEIGLTYAWRQFFKIYPAKSLFVDEQPVWIATDDNPIYIYKTFDKIKGYRPLETNKSNKFLSNVTRYDVQGWEQIPQYNEEETIIITKSLKDIAVLRTLGYLAIAPSSESVLIPPVAMRLLKDKYGIKNFIILYDRDHGGMIGAKKMFSCYRGTYNITFKFIGRGLPKDVADFRRQFGEIATKRYLKYLLNYEPNAKLTVLSANAA